MEYDRLLEQQAKARDEMHKLRDDSLDRAAAQQDADAAVAALRAGTEVADPQAHVNDLRRRRDQALHTHLTASDALASVARDFVEARKKLAGDPATAKALAASQAKLAKIAASFEAAAADAGHALAMHEFLNANAPYVATTDVLVADGVVLTAQDIAGVIAGLVGAKGEAVETP